MVVALILAAFALAALSAWLVARNAALRAELGREQRDGREKIELLAGAREQLETTMKAVAADALRSNSESLLERLSEREKAVESLVKPIGDSLEKIRGEVRTLELARQRDAGALTQHLRDVAATSEGVRAATANLSTALRKSEVRGAWGEMQLRNAVEVAGMVDYCDFDVQVTTSVDGRTLRPDLVVRLPGDRRVVVDAKTPLTPLLDSIGAEDEAARQAHVKNFARLVREHVAALEAKAYWKQFDRTPEFVIMFLPGESFYRTAIELEPSLLQNRRVILAGPSNLISLLQAIEVGWREEKVHESAAAVSELGRELYDRLAVMADHFGTLGKRLDGAVAAYNQSVGSFERRVLPQARRFADHGVAIRRELPSPPAIERSAQPPQTAELPARAASDAA